jgi:hypothetical protein
MLGYINLDTTFLFRDPLICLEARATYHDLSDTMTLFLAQRNCQKNLVQKSRVKCTQRGIAPRLRMELATAVSSLVHVTPQCHEIHDMTRYTRTKRMRCYARHPTRSAPNQQKSMPNLLHVE